MNNNCVIFQVNEVVDYKDGIVVIGRCTKGPIRVNDGMSHIYKPIYSKVEGHLEIVELRYICKVELKIESIQCYNKYVESIVTGYSGGLYLIGKDILKVKSEIELTNVRLDMV